MATLTAPAGTAAPRALWRLPKPRNAVWLAALIVGVVLLAVAGILALVGRSQVRQAAPPLPTEAVEGIKQDIQTVKERRH